MLRYFPGYTYRSNQNIIAAVLDGRGTGKYNPAYTVLGQPRGVAGYLELFPRERKGPDERYNMETICQHLAAWGAQLKAGTP